MRPLRRWWFWAAAALGFLLLIVLLFAGLVRRASSSNSTWILDVEWRASGGSFAQLFWSGDLRFTAEHSISVPLQPAGDGYQRLRVPLRAERVRWLRFDPSNAAGEISIRRMSLGDETGRVLRTFDAQTVAPAGQIASIAQEGDVLRLETMPGAYDPAIFAGVGCLHRQSMFDAVWRVTSGGLTVLTAVVLLLLGGGAASVARAVIRCSAGAAAAPAPRPSRRRLAAAWLLGLAGIVFSAKLLLMRENPVTAPFWDQWDAEASTLFVPFEHCNLSWPTMFELHNEHRVFFTRLLAMDLLALNGQWDPRLEQVANAAIHTAGAILLVTMFWVASGCRRLDFLVLVAALTFAPPFGWENTLQGFQSAFYFLLLFSVLALWLVTSFPTGSAPWWLGWACAVCGIFSAASGVLIALAAAAVTILALANEPHRWRARCADLGAALAVVVLGYWLASAPLPHHATLRVHTISEFSTALGHGLAWPWIVQPQLAPIVWLPVSLMLLGVFFRRGKSNPFERLTAGLSVWVVLHAGAVAYGRGAGGALPATRYLDFLSLGFFANTMALLTLLDRLRWGGISRQLTLAVVAGWTVVGAAGIDALTGQALRDLSVWRGYFSAQAVTVRQYLRDRDSAAVLRRPPLTELPYPSGERLLTVMQDPYVQRIFPAAVRSPVRIEPIAVTDAAFAPETPNAGVPYDASKRGWWSLARGRVAQGRFESAPIPPCSAGGLLKFQLAGYLGWKGQYFAIRRADTGRDQPIAPWRVAYENWIDMTVPCPDGRFSIVAVDAAPDSWFGFREPVETGRWSSAAESLIAVSRWLLLLTLGGTALVARWT